MAEDQKFSSLQLTLWILGICATLFVSLLAVGAKRVANMDALVAAQDVRIKYLEGSMLDVVKRLQAPRWSKDDHFSYRVEHERYHREAEQEIRSSLAALRRETHASVAKLQSALDMHRSAPWHLRAGVEIEGAKKDIKELTESLRECERHIRGHENGHYREGSR